MAKIKGRSAEEAFAEFVDLFERELAGGDAVNSDVAKAVIAAAKEIGGEEEGAFDSDEGPV